jgi:hypothetical protein
MESAAGLRVESRVLFFFLSLSSLAIARRKQTRYTDGNWKEMVENWKKR